MNQELIVFILFSCFEFSVNEAVMNLNPIWVP